MKSIGQLLKDARQKKNLSFEDVEKLTKIKSEFISNVEGEEWDELPEFTVVSGFVKNLSGVLDLDRDKMISFLKRDYPPKKVSINPKPDLAKNISWGPRITFAFGVISLVFVVAGYLALQYRGFVNPPLLEIFSPIEDQLIRKRDVEVVGKTDSTSNVTVNNQSVIVDPDGKFITRVEVNETTKELVIKASSRAGKESEIIRRIRVEPES